MANLNRNRSNPFVINKRKFSTNPHIEQFRQFRSNPEIFMSPLLDGEENYLHIDFISGTNERKGVFEPSRGYKGRHFWVYEYIIVSLPMSFLEEHGFETLDELRQKKGEQFYQRTLGSLDEYVIRYVHPHFSELDDVNSQMVSALVTNFVDTGAYLFYMDAYIKPLNLGQLEKELAAGNISPDSYDLRFDLPTIINYQYTEGIDANFELPFRPLQSSPIGIHL